MCVRECVSVCVRRVCVRVSECECVCIHTLTHIAPSHDYTGEREGGRGKKGGREGGEEGGVPRAKKKP